MNILSCVLSRSRGFGVFVILVFVALSGSLTPARTADPLPSWNETAAKGAIIAFVKAVTTKDGPNFVPPEERIAAFDNDGTLWTERPFYTQLFFIIDRVKELAPQHPEWKDQEPFKTALAGDMKGLLAIGKKKLLELLAAVHTGMTTDEFTAIVTDWIQTNEHPTFKRKYAEVVYQPMLELLDYLRANGFKTYIVTGASQEFVRPFAEKVYGVMPEQVIGSSVKTHFELRDGKSVVVREPELFLFDKRQGKVVGIQKFIGRRPIAAFGNSDGDLQMLQWATDGDGLRFGLIVNHTDGEREEAYNRGLDKALEEAKQKGWTVVDMKKDWKTVFSKAK